MQIKKGVRPKNPLRKRVWRDCIRDWKRYLMISIILIVTIAFSSGMYVANNSMLNTLDKNISKFNREDGHFMLSEKPAPEIIAGIETGERTDVISILRERAYKEAEDEVEKAVKDAVRENVEKTVSDAITEQVRTAVDAQFAAAAANGMEIPDEQREKTLNEAIEKAMSENYDNAVKDALKEAYDSQDYKDALSDAMNEAKEEIDSKIEEKYTEIEKKYELDKEADPVPVDIYELFYKEVDEKIPSDDAFEGKIRVYRERTGINRYDILEGKSPENANEIVIDRMHADNNNIKVGDTIKVGNNDFTISGLVAFVDYTSLFENNTDMMFNALTFDIAAVNDDGYERIKAAESAVYAFRYKNPPADLFEEKKLSDNFMKALITQVAVSEEELEIKDYVPSYANAAVTFASDDMGKDKAMGGIILYILTAVLAFIFAVTISTTLEKESSVIGTLRASGYTRGELLVYYMSAPVMIVVLAALTGNILGYTVFKDIVVGMYRGSYSLPTYETLWNADAFVKTTIVPIILMLVINFFIITNTLKLSPLRFLRHDLKKSKRKKAVRLPKWKFFKRFRIRVFLQNIPNYIMLFVGITFVMVLLSMAVGMPMTLSDYKNSVNDMMLANNQVMLMSTEGDDGNVLDTKTDGAERFSAASLEYKSKSYNEEVSIYGTVKGSRYIKLSERYFDSDDKSVYISKAFSEKYKIHEGDTVKLSEKYENKDYEWKVYGIYDYSAGIAVFMSDDMFKSEFEKDDDYFSGYLSDKDINDIDEKYIAKNITADDMAKVANQLDNSMGAYMSYFQYVCVIVSAVLLYLLTKIIIEKNERSISMVKILGYSDGEISSLYMMTTAIVVVISEIIAIYLGFGIMSFFWEKMMMTMGGWFRFTMTLRGFIKEFVLVFIAYIIITIFDFIRIRNIPKSLALKNVE